MSERRLRWLDQNCHVCGERLNSWDQRVSRALGYQRITCERCIAREYDQPVEQLREALEDFFGMRPCIGL